MKNSVTLCLENREQHFYGMLEQEAEEMTTGHDFVEDELTLLGTGLDYLQRLVETEDGVHGPHHTLGKTGDAETAENLVVLHLRGPLLVCQPLKGEKDIGEFAHSDALVKERQ